jgi:hypothetical protein
MLNTEVRSETNNKPIQNQIFLQLNLTNDQQHVELSSSSSSNFPIDGLPVLSLAQQSAAVINNAAKRARMDSTNSSTTIVISEDSTHSSEKAPKRFELSSYIEENHFNSAPVHMFKHVRLSSFWKDIYNEDLIVEVPNLDYADEASNWFAHVLTYQGYFLKLRYIGFEQEAKYDFWMHICDDRLNPVGWSTLNGSNLVPPAKALIERNHEDWTLYLQKKLIGHKTLPKAFRKTLCESTNSRFKKGMLLETVDKLKFSRMRISRIVDNIGGRLRIKYENTGENDVDYEFWCHERSNWIHPIGWSSTIGVDIYASDGKLYL